MGMFSLAPPSTKVATVNMISTIRYNPKGKEVVESSSLGPFEALYDVVQSIFDVHTDDLHLVASDPYQLPYWLKPSLSILWTISPILFHQTGPSWSL